MLYNVMILFPDGSHADFNTSFTREEKYEYERQLQINPYVKTWVISKVGVKHE